MCPLGLLIAFGFDAPRFRRTPFRVQDSQPVVWNALYDPADRNHQPLGPKIPQNILRHLWPPNQPLGTPVVVGHHLDTFSSCILAVDGVAATITRGSEERAARPRSRGLPPFRSREFRYFGAFFLLEVEALVCSVCMFPAPQ